MYSEMAEQALLLNFNPISADTLFYKFNVETNENANKHTLPLETYRYIQRIKEQTCCTKAIDLVCNLETILNRTH